MADKDLVGVDVINTFMDGDREIRGGAQKVDAATAQKWEANGRARILPHPDFVAGVWGKGHVPKWVKDLKAKSVASTKDIPAVAPAAPSVTENKGAPK